MAKRLQMAAALCLFLLSGMAMEDPYSVQVPVPDQSPEARSEAFQRALAAALLKIVGHEVTVPLPQAEPLVEQYAYQETPEGWQLWVRFQRDALNRWLQEHGMPIWGMRPSVILWLAIEEDGRRRLLGEGDERLAPLLLEEASRRGLPLILPLLDLEDLSKVKVGWVWGDFFESLGEASKRYGAEVMLVGKVLRRGQGWLGDWTLYMGGDAERWQVRGSLDAVLRSGVDGAADRLARRLAVVPRSTSTSLAIRVFDVDSFDSYVDTRRYLERLPAVEAVWPRELGPESVLFRVRLKGMMEEIEQAIAVEGKLIPLSVSEGVLEYRRRP